MAYAMARKNPAPAPPVAAVPAHASSNGKGSQRHTGAPNTEIDLGVVLPGGQLSNIVISDSTAMADVLVLIAAKHKLTPSEHMLSVISEETGLPLSYTSLQPIGSLRVKRVFLLTKKIPEKQRPTGTVDVTVNLPKGSKAVFEFASKASIADAFRLVCADRGINPSTHAVLLPGVEDARSPLELTRATFAEKGISSFTIVPFKAPARYQSMMDMSSAHSSGLQREPSLPGKKTRGLFSLFRRKKKNKPDDAAAHAGGEQLPHSVTATPPFESHSAAKNAAKPHASVQPQLQTGVHNLASSVVAQDAADRSPLEVARLPSKKKYHAPLPPAVAGSKANGQLTRSLALSTPNLASSSFAVQPPSTTASAKVSLVPAPAGLLNPCQETESGVDRVDGPKHAVSSVSNGPAMAAKLDNLAADRGHSPRPDDSAQQPPMLTARTEIIGQVGRASEAGATNAQHPAAGTAGSLGKKSRRAPLPPGAGEDSHYASSVCLTGSSVVAIAEPHLWPVFVAPPPPKYPPPPCTPSPSSPSSASSSPGSVRRELVEISREPLGSANARNEVLRSASRNSGTSIDTIADVTRSFEQAIVEGQNALKEKWQDVQPTIANFVAGMDELTHSLQSGDDTTKQRQEPAAAAASCAAVNAQQVNAQQVNASAVCSTEVTERAAGESARLPTPPRDYLTSSSEEDENQHSRPQKPPRASLVLLPTTDCGRGSQPSCNPCEGESAGTARSGAAAAEAAVLHTLDAESDSHKAKQIDHHGDADRKANAAEDEFIVSGGDSSVMGQVFVSERIKQDLAQGRIIGDNRGLLRSLASVTNATIQDESGSVRGVKGCVRAVRSRLFEDEADDLDGTAARFNMPSSSNALSKTSQALDGNGDFNLAVRENQKNVSSAENLAGKATPRVGASVTGEAVIRAGPTVVSGMDQSSAAPLVAEASQPDRVKTRSSPAAELKATVQHPSLVDIPRPAAEPRNSSAADGAQGDAAEARLRRIAGRSAISSSTTQLFSHRAQPLSFAEPSTATAEPSSAAIAIRGTRRTSQIAVASGSALVSAAAVVGTEVEVTGANHKQTLQAEENLQRSAAQNHLKTIAPEFGRMGNAEMSSSSVAKDGQEVNRPSVGTVASSSLIEQNRSTSQHHSAVVLPAEKSRGYAADHITDHDVAKASIVEGVSADGFESAAGDVISTAGQVAVATTIRCVAIVSAHQSDDAREGYKVGHGKVNVTVQPAPTEEEIVPITAPKVAMYQLQDTTPLQAVNQSNDGAFASGMDSSRVASSGSLRATPQSDSSTSTGHPKRTIYSLLRSLDAKVPPKKPESAPVPKEPSAVNGEADDLRPVNASVPIVKGAPAASSDVAQASSPPAASTSEQARLYAPRHFARPWSVAGEVRSAGSSASSLRSKLAPQATYRAGPVSLLPPSNAAVEVANVNSTEARHKQELAQRYEQLQKEVATWRGRLLENEDVLKGVAPAPPAESALRHLPPAEPAQRHQPPAAPLLQQQPTKPQLQQPLMQQQQPSLSRQSGVAAPPKKSPVVSQNSLPALAKQAAVANKITLESMVAQMTQVKLRPAAERVVKKPEPAQQRSASREQLLQAIRDRGVQLNLVDKEDSDDALVNVHRRKPGQSEKASTAPVDLTLHGAHNGFVENDGKATVEVQMTTTLRAGTLPLPYPAAPPPPPISPPPPLLPLAKKSGQRSAAVLKPASLSLDPREELMIAIRNFRDVSTLRVVKPDPGGSPR